MLKVFVLLVLAVFFTEAIIAPGDEVTKPPKHREDLQWPPDHPNYVVPRAPTVGKDHTSDNYRDIVLVRTDDGFRQRDGELCPNKVTGQFTYLPDCRKFVNCWKGRGFIQACAPGTLFNPKSLECDFPAKVKCLPYEEGEKFESIKEENIEELDYVAKGMIDVRFGAEFESSPGSSSTDEHLPESSFVPSKQPPSRRTSGRSYPNTNVHHSNPVNNRPLPTGGYPLRPNSNAPSQPSGYWPTRPPPPQGRFPPRVPSSSDPGGSGSPHLIHSPPPHPPPHNPTYHLPTPPEVPRSQQHYPHSSRNFPQTHPPYPPQPPYNPSYSPPFPSYQPHYSQSNGSSHITRTPSQHPPGYDLSYSPSQSLEPPQHYPQSENQRPHGHQHFPRPYTPFFEHPQQNVRHSQPSEYSPQYSKPQSPFLGGQQNPGNYTQFTNNQPQHHGEQNQNSGGFRFPGHHQQYPRNFSQSQHHPETHPGSSSGEPGHHFYPHSVETPHGRVVPTTQNKHSECSMPGGTGLAPHPTDCRKYLNCWKGSAHTQFCAPSTLFNPVLLLCDHPYNVDCKKSTSIQDPGKKWVPPKETTYSTTPHSYSGANSFNIPNYSLNPSNQPGYSSNPFNPSDYGKNPSSQPGHGSRPYDPPELGPDTSNPVGSEFVDQSNPSFPAAFDENIPIRPTARPPNAYRPTSIEHGDKSEFPPQESHGNYPNQGPLQTTQSIKNTTPRSHVTSSTHWTPISQQPSLTVEASDTNIYYVPGPESQQPEDGFTWLPESQSVKTQTSTVQSVTSNHQPPHRVNPTVQSTTSYPRVRSTTNYPSVRSTTNYSTLRPTTKKPTNIMSLSNSSNSNLKPTLIPSIPVRPVVGYSPSLMTSGQVLRLRGGQGPFDGYVEVQGTTPGWGLVCDETGGWSIDEATIVCQQLGFTRGAELSWQGRPVRPIDDTIHISISEVRCAGNEKDFFSCRMTRGAGLCLISRDAVGVRCYRNYVSVCQEGEVNYGGKCYSVIVPKEDTALEAFSHGEALADCQKRKGKLLDITSQAENDFISELLLQSYPHINSIITSGIGVKVMGHPLWIWEGSGESFKFQKWWPGWTGNETAPTATTSGDRMSCVVAKRVFPCQAPYLPDVAGLANLCEANYFYWATEDCGVTHDHPYVCERLHDDVGCVNNAGQDYMGTANISVTGSACLPWDSPLTPAALKYRMAYKVRQKTMVGHNYCRNVAGGETHPWCYVGPEAQFQYCDIPECQSSNMLGVSLKMGSSLNPEDIKEGYDVYFECNILSKPKDYKITWFLNGQEIHHNVVAGVIINNQNLVLMRVTRHSAGDYTCFANNTEGKGMSNPVELKVVSAETTITSSVSKVKSCGIQEFECRPGECIASSLTCDQNVDCSNGKDEEECPDPTVCGSNEFQCRAREVIAAPLMCDGKRDCSNGRDEQNCTGVTKTSRGGREFVCRPQECILSSRLCDGVLDCADGSDEVDCREGDDDPDACPMIQFKCKPGHCIPSTWVCDGVADCDNEKDEHNCPGVEKAVRDSLKCGPKEFECQPGECVFLTWVCDGAKDCSNGRDEKDCSGSLGQFLKHLNRRLIKHDKQKWLESDATMCAEHCINAKEFTCRSFSHLPKDRICVLSDSNVGLSGDLNQTVEWHYYERRSTALRCDNLFHCDNGKCVNRSMICDGKNNCGDRSDERNCSAEYLDYEIRLAGGNSSNEGRVEVKVFGQWGAICDDLFGLRDAEVVCRELNFTLGAAEVVGQSMFGGTSPKFLVDDLQCRGDETSIRECDFDGWGVHDCGPEEAVGVVCRVPGVDCKVNYWRCDKSSECIPIGFLCDNVPDCEDGSDESATHCEAPVELRLAGGPSNMSGRVEVRYNGVWGTICDDDFTDTAALVICRMLGFGGVSEARKGAAFGPGEGQIWLDQLHCTGKETHIEDCIHSQWGENNCGHEEDASIICSVGEVPKHRNERNKPEVVATRISSPDVTTNQILPSYCGLKADDYWEMATHNVNKVVGGNEVAQGSFPWQASVRVRTAGKSVHWCGAVVLSPLHILTAGHCLQDYTKGAYLIRVGDHDTEANDGTEQEASIEEIYLHEGFNKGPRLSNDIALVKLKSGGVRLGHSVQPICLPPANVRYHSGLNCSISGWGTIKAGGTGYARKLQAAWLSFIPNDVCRADYVYGSKAITEGMICAGDLEGRADSCQGDSGGPLICLNNGRLTLFGITSWGHGCGRPNRPGVYSQIGHFRPWIDQKLKASMTGK